MRFAWKALFGWWSSGIESEASAHRAQRGLRTFVTSPSAIFATALMAAGSVAGLPTRAAAQPPGPALEAPQPGLFGPEGAIPPLGAEGEVEGIPPYWTETDGGWQRVQGFWIGAETRELEYREPPPESLEVGPTSPAPAEDYSYVPGTWLYQDNGYRWRTGYWTPYQPDWVWTPARWIWTPGGCVYSAGFWDHRPIVRAQMFAPIAFSSPLYLQPGFRYRPWCALDTNRFFIHLWIGPRANNYFFGNYYGVGSRLGFSPWCDWSYRSRRCFDPLWSWCDVHYRRQGVNYIGRVRGWHDHYRRNEFDRPGRTWREQSRLIADNSLDRRRSQNILAADLRDVVRRDDLPLRFNRLDDRDRDVVRTISDEHRKLRETRNQLEREARIARGGDARIGEGRGGEGRGEGREPGSRGPDDRGPNDRGPGGRDLADGQTPREGRTETNRPNTEGRVGDAPRRPGDLASNRDESDRGPGREREPSRDSESREGRTARVTLPEQSEAAREMARNSRRQLPEGIARPDAVDRSRREGRPGSPGRPQPGAGRGAEAARERGPADTREGRAETSREGRVPRPGESSRPQADRAPVESTPQVDTPRTERPRSEPRSEESQRPDGTPIGPRRETARPPRVSGAAVDLPGIASPRTTEGRSGRTEGRTPAETRSEQPRTDVPRSDRPRVETPRIPSPRTETRRVEAPRVEAPRIERPSPATRSEPRSAPRVETRSTPRVETRSEPRSSPQRSSGPQRSGASERSSAAPRISIPSTGGSSSRGSSARTVAPPRSSSAPRVQSSRSNAAPRVQSRPSSSARMQPSRSSSPSRSSASSRGSSSRPQAARSGGGGGSRSSGKGRGRD